jgi:hypothetical protein
MKSVLCALMLTFSLSSFSQTIDKQLKTELDSLSKKYKKNVCGYMKTIVDDRESLVLFYRVNNEMNETLAWTRKIKKYKSHL